MTLTDRILEKFGLQRRSSLEAAGGYRRWSSGSSTASLNNTSLSSGIVARRALYTVANNSHAAAALRVLVSNLVGTGIHPRSKHPAPRVRKALHKRFARFCYAPEVRGNRDFAGMQADIVSNMVMHGECFARRQYLSGANGGTELKIQVIHPDQCPRSFHKDLPGGNYVRQGIEFDSKGRISAYHFLDHRPDDLHSPTSYTPKRVPVDQVCHLLRPVEAGQIRGISWFAPVLMMINELDQWQDATLVKQKLAAMYAGILTDPDGSGSPFVDENNGDKNLPQLESGTIVSMPPGKQLDFTDPPSGSDFPPMAKYYLQAIASGLGLGYDQLTGDLEKVNFSSIRAGTIEFRRFVSQVQHQIIIRNLCNPIWRWWIDFEILSGRLSAGQREQYLDVKWLPPKFAYVDPAKDAKADEILHQNRFKSRTEIVAERGYDVEEVDAEFAADLNREQRLGLTPKASADDAIAAAQIKDKEANAANA